jgi:hypothetical protein
MQSMKCPKQLNEGMGELISFTICRASPSKTISKKSNLLAKQHDLKGCPRLRHNRINKEKMRGTSHSHNKSIAIPSNNPITNTTLVFINRSIPINFDCARLRCLPRDCRTVLMGLHSLSVYGVHPSKLL